MLCCITDNLFIKSNIFHFDIRIHDLNSLKRLSHISIAIHVKISYPNSWQAVVDGLLVYVSYVIHSLLWGVATMSGR